MAIKQPVYERSAVDIISPMLSINQGIANRNTENWNRISTGVKGLSEGLSGAYAMKKRADEIEYKGDQYLADLEGQLAEAKSELTNVENSMRTIKAEDLGSLDEERLEEGNKPYDYSLGNTTPYDVDTMDLDGSRTFPLGDVNPPLAQKSAATVDEVFTSSSVKPDNLIKTNSLGKAFNLEMGDVSEEDMIEYGKHRYKPGMKALGGK